MLRYYLRNRILKYTIIINVDIDISSICYSVINVV